ncbi:hypothetical protein [Microcoleus sp. herbarium14]|jgi:hypothetical protein|uniref:hypothetical protein n=1 Tax=Microcoleus sp. herbarium14 TaxID=3055439 RepID=UPI002FD77DE1
MKDTKLDLISTFKFEKRLKLFVAVYLSLVLLAITALLIKIEMPSELQQALIIILGLITIATLDAFRKALDSTGSSLANQFNQIILQDGGLYVSGNYTGDYVFSRDINQGGEKTKTLAEAAAEIQELLIQLEKSKPNATEAEKVAYVNDETPPALKSRVASAAKAGGEAAVDTILDNSPYGNIARAVLRAWISLV